MAQGGGDEQLERDVLEGRSLSKAQIKQLSRSGRSKAICDTLAQEWVTQGSLDKNKKTFLAHFGQSLSATDVARRRAQAGITLTDPERKLLLDADGYYDYDGDLASRDSDIDLGEARRLLEQARESKKPPEDVVDNVAPLGGGSVGSTTPYDSSPFGTSSSSSPYEDPVALIEDPALAEKIRRALAKGTRQELSESLLKEARERADALDRTEAEDVREQEREAFRQKVTQDTGTEGDSLYTSARALQEVEQEKTFRQTHKGEFEKYNTGAESIILGNNGRIENTLVAKDGTVITEMTTQQLSEEEREKTILKGRDGTLVRSDETPMDTSGSAPVLTVSVTAENREAWVLDKDGQLRAGGQLDMSEGYTELQLAQEKLFQAEGRRVPLDEAEARKYGFPQNVRIAHHTTLSDGEDVRAAGEMSVVEGEVQTISNASGHYRPDAESTMSVVDILDKMGVVGRSIDGTRVEVFNEDGAKEIFLASEILAAGNSLARARLLRQERLRREAPANTDQLSQEQKELLEDYQKRIKAVQSDIVEKLPKRLKTFQRKLKETQDTLGSLQKQDTPDPQEVLAQELELVKLQEKARGTDEKLQEVVRQVSALIGELETELRKAGVDEAVILDILRKQKRGVGRINEAQQELLVWMNAITDRRHELDDLKALTRGEDFQSRKQKATEVLESLLGKKKNNDEGDDL